MRAYMSVFVSYVTPLSLLSVSPEYRESRARPLWDQSLGALKSTRSVLGIVLLRESWDEEDIVISHNALQ